MLVDGYNYAHFNRNRKDMILIRDVDKEYNLGFFESKTVLFKRENIVGLCLGTAVRENKEKAQELTIHVYLNKKQ